MDEPRRVCCGLVWPEKGSPAYFCVLGDKPQEKTRDFYSSAQITVLKEGEAATFSELSTQLENLPPHHLRVVYTEIEVRFSNYVREYNRWKNDKRIDTKLYATKSASFEASLLKIKEMVQSKRLILPFESKLRHKLASFAKSDMSDEVHFPSIRALSYAIWAFDKRRPTGEPEIVPKLKGWW